MINIDKFRYILNFIDERTSLQGDGGVVTTISNLTTNTLNHEDILHFLSYLEHEQAIEELGLYIKLKDEDTPIHIEDRLFFPTDRKNIYNSAQFEYNLLEVDSDYFIYFKVNFEKLRPFLENKPNSSTNSLPIYNNDLGIVTYKDKIYSVQKEERKKLLQILWEKRRLIQKGDVVIEGEYIEKPFLAKIIGLIRNEHAFNSAQRESLNEEIKQLNNIFREKNIPITISGKGGVLLIIETD